MLSEASRLIPCRGCGALVPNLKGSAHPFIGASMGCWSVYGEVLLLQYGHSPTSQVHRLTADAYGAQHPGVIGPQSTQSVGAHLVGLYLTLVRPYDFLNTINLLEKALRLYGFFTWLEPPKAIYRLTILDVRASMGTPEHDSSVRCWAQEVWDAWNEYHPAVERWVKQLER